ncbi:DUF948 domain-containing protein [Oceanobacillus iheyensis]|uniref:General stress protein n=1 Tax=Oceanobacillus iheyensis (strain DSM 14371 / CIP 107618 / JCM 11309 / KCTC 3954 / HTE831) TaxID=221109 RepID=Q8ETR6_OCEIH|nr:DUF948 domain-containing protein [Oceanobacillus iheyensis]BAC12147.1 general stress protein [Oceanobacillus iheyensis HTE831]
MAVIYVGILFIAVAFAIVACYAAFALSRFSDTMRSLGRSMTELEKEMHYITPQLTESLQEADKLVDDISEKVKATDSVFDHVEDVGTSVQTMNQLYLQQKETLSEAELEKKLQPFITGITWSEAFMQVFKTYQTGKGSSMNDSTSVNTGREG